MTKEEAQLALANLKRYMSGGGAVDRNTNKAINMAIEALSQSEPHWIPVDLENNKPPLEEWVFVSSDGYVMQDCVVERGGRKIWYHGGNIQPDDRYMPLPEPYKGVTT